MLSEIEKLNQVWLHLQDDWSRRIFEQRVLWSVTNDISYTSNMLLLEPEIKDVVDELRKHKTQKKILFGAGLWSKEIFSLCRYFPDIQWECFCDNYKKGTHCNLPIIPFDDLKSRYMDACIVISTGEYDAEVTRQCLHAGFREENLVHAGKAIIELGLKQYFDNSIFPSPISGNAEIFVDAGSLNGMTSIEFCRQSKMHYHHVYAFEPNPFMYEEAQKNLEKYSDVTLIKKGLWDESGELLFVENKENEGGSSLLNADMTLPVDGKKVSVPVTTLDECLNDVPVTFIKMDIEGSERQALQGAKNLIKRYRPRMAICVYHKKSDLWEIPNLILSFHSDYRFYLRHYAVSENELVLYAL